MAQQTPWLTQRWLQEGLAHQKQGRIPEAVAAYQKVLEADPRNIDALNLYGVIRYQQGDVDGAIEMLEKARKRSPGNAVVLNNLAKIHEESGRADEAVKLLRRAVKRHPDFADAHLNLVKVLGRIGDPSGVIKAARAAERVLGDDPRLLIELAMAQIQTGADDTAIETYRRVLAKEPDHAIANANIGALLKRSGRLHEARGHLERALRRNPGDINAANNLAGLLAEQGHIDAARALFNQILELAPDDVDALYNLGYTYQIVGDRNTAADYYRRVVQIDPNFAAAYNNMGCMLADAERGEDAEPYFIKVLEVQPNHVEAMGNLGLIYKNKGRYHDALALFEQARSLSPNPALDVRSALTLPVIPENREAMLEARRRLETEVDRLSEAGLSLVSPDRTVGVVPFQLAYQGLDDRPLMEKIAGLYRTAAPSLNMVASHAEGGEEVLARAKAEGRRLKIGFISKYFRDHAVTWTTRGLIERMPTDRFEVSMLAFEHPRDDAARELATKVEHFVCLPDVLEPARDAVASLELDVLVYADIGMHPLTYFMAYARLAPVQVVMGGHPVTTGLDTIDYYLSTRDLEPEGADDHYTERLVRLDSIAATYRRPAVTDEPLTRADFGLPEGRTVYLCAQSLFKIHPDFDSLIARILEADPDGVITLFDGQPRALTELLRDRFARQLPGSAMERVIFLPRQKFGRFMRVIELSDVFLDTTHFGGGNTVFQAFAVGTPVVTLPGPFMRGRAAYALYLQMGIRDGIARDEDDYVARAVALGSDAEAHSALRRQILDRNDVLFDNPGFVTAVAGFLDSLGTGA